LQEIESIFDSFCNKTNCIQYLISLWASEREQRGVHGDWGKKETFTVRLPVLGANCTNGVNHWPCGGKVTALSRKAGKMGKKMRGTMFRAKSTKEK
jgi:hypothetical protein